MTPKFAVGLIFFNDAKSLERCLPTLKPFDYVFCIDGKYDSFNYHSDLSDDGSREIVNRFPNTVLIDAPNLKEFQKRQVYFDVCEQYDGVDYLVIVDSDEYMHGDWELFTKTWIKRMEKEPHHLNVAPVQWAGHPSHWQNIPVCVYKPYEVEYRRTHWSHAKKGSPMGEWLNGVENVGWTDGIRFFHDHKLRGQDYMKRREKFEQAQAQYEVGVNLFTGENRAEAEARIRKEMGLSLTPSRR